MKKILLFAVLTLMMSSCAAQHYYGSGHSSSVKRVQSYVPRASSGGSTIDRVYKTAAMVGQSIDMIEADTRYIKSRLPQTKTSGTNAKTFQWAGKTAHLTWDNARITNKGSVVLVERVINDQLVSYYVGSNTDKRSDSFKASRGNQIDDVSIICVGSRIEVKVNGYYKTFNQ